MGDFLANGRIVFGDFELDPERRVLTRDGQKVPLGAKAYELLLTLIENRDKVVTKEFLLEKVWEGQFVEENNLTVHIAAIRKALGEQKGQHRYILTVPGKGYKFVGKVGAAELEKITVETNEVQSIVIEEYEDEEIVIRPRNVLSLPPAKRSGRWMWAAVPILLLIAGGGWLLFSGSREARTRFDTPPMTSRIFSVPGAVPQRVAISPDGRKIAFTKRASGKDALWIGDLESNSSIQLTEPAERLHNTLQFSPDGGTVYFTARDANYPVWTLMSVSASGGAVRDLGVEVDGDIAVSPDGRLLAHFTNEGGKRSAIIVRDASSGSNPRAVFRVAEGERIFIPYLAWSPAGRVTVWVSDSGTTCRFLDIDPSSGTSRSFGQGPCENVSNFEWFGDGSAMVITETLAEDARRSQLRLLNPANGERRELTNDAFHYASLSLSTSRGGRVAALEVRNLLDISTVDPYADSKEEKRLSGGSNNEGAHGVAAAPDGKFLYTVKVGRSRAIWQIDPDGTGARELVKPENGREDMQLSVSADNRFIVFDSNRTGKWEVWRANRDGSGSIALTSDGDNAGSTVTPDGKFVLYRAEGAKKGIWKVPIDGGAAELIIGDDCSWPDVSPDGRFLACASGRDDEGPKRKIKVYTSDGRLFREFSVGPSSILYNRLRWSPDGRSIIYKDVVDGLWEQPLDGASPRRMAGFDSIRVFHFNRAGENEIVYSGGIQGRNIMILEPAAVP
jgi:DNA-binding winged helix-turn-helix (wHTH) protein/Tol biopolymer transport system component